MLKFFSFGKINTGVFITLLVLIALGSSYFFIYLPGNEKVVQERRFRCLRKIDTNIRAKMDNSFALIKNLLENYDKNSPPYPKSDKRKDIVTKNSLFKAVKDYIKNYPQDNFTLLLPEQADEYFNQSNESFIKKDEKNQPIPKNQPILIEEDPSENIQFYIDVGSQFTLLARKTKSNNGASKNNNRSKKIDTSGNRSIGIQFEFDKFFKSLLSIDDFDNYVVFINDQKHYESFPSGLNYAVADSLLAVRNKISTPGVRSIKIGETDYKAFSHPLYTYTGNKWIVTGLVSGNNYEKEKNQLPLWVLLLLLTVAIAMLVSLPWIKLYHMGNKDRLTNTEAIESVLVSMILMSLLFFMIFKYHPDFNLKEKQLLPYTDKSQGNISYPRDAYSRNVLATKITSAFEKEIDDAYNLLHSLDRIHQKKDTDVCLLGKGKEYPKIKYFSLLQQDDQADTIKKDGNIIAVKKKFKEYNKKPDSRQGNLYTKYDTLFKNHSQGIDLVQVFWLNDRGDEKTNLTVDSNNDPKGNYSYRNYFKNAIAKKYNKTGSSKFYIDQIVSHTENTFRSVISKKTDSDQVIVMGFRVKSLDSVIMPDGYQFAIIDNNGRILYHSRPNRNLNENLKNEFADSSKLVSSIEARSDTTFKVEYYGKRYNVKIKPMPDLPYFTIIFEDLEYNDIRDTEAYSFTLSMLICMLVFVSIRYGLVFFSSSRRSFLKKHHFDTSWIGPHIKCHHQYNLATLANLSIILLLIIFFNKSSFLEYLYILLVSVGFTSLFLTVVFAGKYKNTDPYKYKFKIRAIIWLSIFISLIDTAACIHLTGAHVVFLLLYELLLIGIGYIIFFYGISLLTMAYEFKSFAWTFTHSYALMVTTRLIISSGIPVAFFFIYSYNYEQNLGTRYRQLNFAKALSQKIDLNQENTADVNKKLDSINNNLLDTSGIYSDGRLIDSIKLINKADSVKLISPYSPEDSLTAKILGAFRLRLNNVEIENNNLNLPSADNTAFFSKLNKQADDTSPTQIFYKIDSNKYIKISSLLHTNYVSPPVFSLLLLIVLIVIFYYMIHNIIRKLFAINLLPRNRWEQLDGELLKNNKFNKLVFIVGSPGSNTLSKLKYEILHDKKIKGRKNTPLVLEDKDPSKINVFIADMMKISAENGESDPDWKRHKKEALNDHSLVIINHFEYNIKNPAANKIKLDLLELLKEQNTNKNTSKVIIISTVHPLIFLDSFNKQQQNPMPECERGRWHNLLGNFHVVIDPLIRSTNLPEDSRAPQKAIIQETKHSRFLHRMQRFYLEFLSKEIAVTSLGIKEKKYSCFLEFLDQEIALISQNETEAGCKRLSKFINQEIGLIRPGEKEATYNRFLWIVREMIVQLRDQEIAPVSTDDEKTRYNNFLHEIRKTVIKLRDQEAALISSDEEAKVILRDSMIFKLQLTSQYFYTDIWQSLTHEEKFMLYDLAEDGLVNSYDSFNLSMLICKGLIINDDGVLMLFNQSFRNFVLTAIGENEMNRIKEQIKDNGRWGDLKAPLNLAILAILAFLFASQQEAYSRVLGYITAFTAGIPTISRIFTMFTSVGKTPKAE